MFDEGYFYLERKLFQDELFKKERKHSEFEAWIDLIRLAKFAPEYVEIKQPRVLVRRGEMQYTLRTLAERWRWSTTKTVRFLDYLENRNSISRKKIQGVSLLFLVNYNEYQTKQKKEDTLLREKVTRKRQERNNETSKPLKNKGRETPKEGKVKKGKKHHDDDFKFFKKGDREYQESIRKETGNAKYSLITEILEIFEEYGVTDPNNFLEKYSLRDIYEEMLYCEDNKGTIKNKGATLRNKLKGREKC